MGKKGGASNKRKQFFEQAVNEDDDIVFSGGSDEEEQVEEVDSNEDVADSGSEAENEEENEEEDEIERQLVEEMKRKAASTDESKAVIYHKTLLLERCGDFIAHLPWAERLDIASVPISLEDNAANDDLKREVAFYSHAVECLKIGRSLLAQHKIPYKRPVDFFAEMLKSDAHMAKVKDKLIYEQKKMQAVDERKKSQEHKKIAKKLQAEKVQEKSRRKKDMEKAVSDWKKRDSKEMLDGNDDFDAHLNNAAKAGQKRKAGGDSKPKKGFKRMKKDEKFGYGGKKAGKKRNDKKSSNDMSGFSLARNNQNVGKRGRKNAAAGGKRGATGGSGGNRPGKARRQNARSQRK